MKTNEQIVSRMKNALISGRDISVEHMLRVLKSDEYRLLSNYMTFEPGDLKMTVDLMKDGSVDLVISVKAERFEHFGRTIE